MSEFHEDLTKLLKRHKVGIASGTPDEILAAYAIHCIGNLNVAVKSRKEWLLKASQGPVNQVEN